MPRESSVRHDAQIWEFGPLALLPDKVNPPPTDLSHAAPCCIRRGRPGQSWGRVDGHQCRI